MLKVLEAEGRYYMSQIYGNHLWDKHRRSAPRRGEGAVLDGTLFSTLESMVFGKGLAPVLLHPGVPR